MPALAIDSARLRYRALIGVGGIGAGSFFAISGNETLGREESRGGRFLDQRDYCKLHIIAHYVQTLLGPIFTTLPVGKVGDDDTGRRLTAEMGAAGMDTRHVSALEGGQTMFSFCFLYPDGGGGNLTTDDSACARVDAALVGEAEDDFRLYHGAGIALAAPEVSLEARAALLERATAHEFFRAASFTAEEVGPAMRAGMMGKADLVALNRGEAARAAGLPAETPVEELGARAVERLRAKNPALMVSITAGAEGSWLYEGPEVHRQAAWNAEVRNTAGAGDAHLAGLLAGFAAGLAAEEAQQLAGLVAALSVESPHTIHPGVRRDSLREFARRQGGSLGAGVRALLG
jgi:ribokinase